MNKLRSLHPLFIVVTLIILAVVTTIGVAWAQTSTQDPAQKTEPERDTQSSENEPPASKPAPEGTMTLDKIGLIVKRLDSKAQRTAGSWQLTVEKVPVLIVTDANHDRMRILVAVRKTEDLNPEELQRMMQANFDSALDSRYAIANNILWSTYIHPLRALHDRQFIAAIGQTVNLALTYGSSYTSGLLLYGGGDSKGIIQRQLIDRLLKKGQPI